MFEFSKNYSCQRFDLVLFIHTDSCPAGWKAFRGQCYLFQKSKATLRWTAAEEICKMYGGHLVSMRDKNDMEIVHTILTENSVERASRTFIGMHNNNALSHHYNQNGYIHYNNVITCIPHK